MDKAKRGAGSPPRNIVEINHEGGFVTVPSRAGKRIRAAFGDTRAVPSDDQLSSLVHSAIYELDPFIAEMFDAMPGVFVYPTSDDRGDDKSSSDVFEFTNSVPLRPDTGSRVEVFWPLDNCYYAGEVTTIHDDGNCVVLYDHEQSKVLAMSNETWQFEQSPLIASTLEIFKSLDLNEQAVIQGMMEQLGQKPFLWHHAQVLYQSAIVSSYLERRRNILLISSGFLDTKSLARRTFSRGLCCIQSRSRMMTR